MKLTADPNRGQGVRVLGRITSDKKIRNSVVQNVLKIAWEMYGLVRISEADECTLNFEFQNDNDRDQILDL